MPHPSPRSRPPHAVALTAALALLPAGYALAQTVTAPAAAASAPADGLQLDRIVVTGTSQASTKMRSSVSISTIEGEGVVTATAGSAADVLRSVPGLRAEASGGESNANIGVRGIPISAGGARYIQFQEDGLPILQFGDIAFATPDTFVRADVGLDRLEVVRGGSASTLATGAPGGIINYITKTGEVPGGSLSLGYGLDHAHTRVDLDYGGALGARTRGWIGGFQRIGDGGREGAEGTQQGGQIRGNLTHEFDRGSLRLSFKHLDDRTPSFMPTPVRYDDGKIREIPGLDPRRTAFYDAGWPLDVTLTGSNGSATTRIGDGLHARSDAFGALLDIDAGGGLKLINNLRIARNSGRFVGIFPGDDVVAAPAGTTVATGPDAGDAYTGDKFTAVVFNTSLDDLSLLANDLKLSRAFDVGDGGTLTATGGLYTSVQDLKITWNFNQYSLSAAEDGARLLNVPGVDNGTPGFGGCCMNHQDSTYTTRALYAGLGWTLQSLSLDASVRHDRNKASGAYYQSQASASHPTQREYDLADPNLIDYRFGRTSYSVGANYQFRRDLAVFARYSDGAAYNADRITFFNDPGLVDGSSSVIPVNEVRQLEGGAKWRAGGLSMFATVFLARTEEINVDLTSSPINVTATEYDSRGLELELAWRGDAWSVNGGVTFTDAEVTASSNAALVGKTPKRQARAVYQLTPTWHAGDSLMLGASIVGTTGSKDDGPGGPVTIELPGYTTVNAFVNYALTPQASVSLTVGNLFDTIGYTESNDGRGAARSINGRTARAVLKYTF